MSGSGFITAGPIPDFQNDGLSEAMFNLNVGASGAASTIISAVSGKRIFVHSMMFAFGNANPAIQFYDLNTSNATVAFLTGTIATSGGVFYSLPYSQYPWFTCAAGDAFGIANIQGGGATMGGRVLYVQG